MITTRDTTELKNKSQGTLWSHATLSQVLEPYYKGRVAQKSSSWNRKLKVRESFHFGQTIYNLAELYSRATLWSIQSFSTDI